MHGSSVYGVLESEDSHFNMCAMAEEQENSKLIVLFWLSCVLDAGNWTTAGL